MALSSYIVSINPTNVKTPCNGYFLYTGTTTSIDSATPLNNGNLVTFDSTGHTFNLDVDSSYDSVFLFVEHCDGHITPVPSSTPKRQGGYQVLLLDLRCEVCGIGTLICGFQVGVELLSCDFGVDVSVLSCDFGVDVISVV